MDGTDYRSVRKADFEELREYLDFTLPSKRHRDMAKLRDRYEGLEAQTLESLKYKNNILVAEVGSCPEKKCDLFKGHKGEHLSF